MRILTWDELPSSVEAERVGLELAAFSGPLDRRTVEVYRRARLLLSEYVGLFAVDRGEILGQTAALRIPYRTRSGVETVTGVASVTTRRDAGGRGIARTILEEVHRREAEAGARFALLWTNPSWYAHTLYERLGYRDVWIPPLAVRTSRPGRVRRPALRPATSRDLGALERLHRETLGDLCGFAPRPERFLTVPYRAGHLDLAGLGVARVGGRPVGYAVSTTGPGLVRCGELVARPEHAGAVLDALEATAGARDLAVGNSPALALRAELRRRGYWLRERHEWRTLMARPLRGRATTRALREELAVDRPEFVCLGLDRF